MSNAILQILLFLTEKGELRSKGKNFWLIDRFNAHSLAFTILLGSLHDVVDSFVADIFADVLTTPFWLHFFLPFCRTLLPVLVAQTVAPNAPVRYIRARQELEVRTRV